MGFVVWIVRRDSRELPLPIRWTLGVLRILAVVCVVIYLLNPGQRSELRLITNSRLAILIDTSLSMGLPAAGTDREGSPRAAQVINWFENQRQIKELRAQHDVTIYRFGESASPAVLAELPKLAFGEASSSSVEDTRTTVGTSQLATRLLPVVTWLTMITSVVILFGWLVAWRNSQKQRSSRLLAACVLTLMAGLILVGISDLLNPEQSLREAMLFQENATVKATETLAIDPANNGSKQDQLPNLDWARELQPRDTASQIGAAIQHVVNKERGGPLAGIMLFSDGGSNAGLPLPTAVAAAKNANVPLFPVGVGSIKALKNVAIAYVEAPPRVLPNDEFKLKAVLKAFGYGGRQIRVTVKSSVVDGPETEEDLEQLDGEQSIDLKVDDGVPISVEFELKAEQEGKRRFRVEIEALENDSDPKDNSSDAIVEVVERKTKVMLIAGGPSREFRFLRNQLFRDKNITSDVWLQSATKGADQESNLLLSQFPTERDELLEYDCIVAFDPDWRTLTIEQTQLLENWVAESAGGLILIAGPVNTPEWTRRPRGDDSIDVIRDLYPVVFFNQGSARLKLGRFGGIKPFPLAFTREGRAARFLWLGDSAAESAMTWSQFEGVFGYYAVNEAKSGADVLANFSDESTAINDEYPIYLASQFYGAGRVLFQASGEMWRVRRIDVDHFQDYYDQLIRWASQGRLIRDSSRGVLLTDRDRCWVGDRIRVQAILRDAQDAPYLAEAITASLVLPDGSTEILELRSAGAAIRPGTFDGFVPVEQQGGYRVILPVPDSPTGDILNKEFQAAIPDLEKLKPLRNDADLQFMADETGGTYYTGVDALNVDASDPTSPLKTIEPQDQEAFLTGTLNRIFQQKLMTWLLVWITFAFCMAWTIRRCHKLS